MPHNVVIIADPGIDGAFAVTLAMYDPGLQVLGLAATAGNVAADQATKNVHILAEQLDPPRSPRLAAPLPVEYDVDGTKLHGPGGLAGTEFPCRRLHHTLPTGKLVADQLRQHPHEVTLVCMGPLTVLARALDRDPELPTLVRRVVCLGGAWREPGNAGPVSEFHFFCDPAAARQVLRAGFPLTLIPLDLMRKVIFAPTDLLQLPVPEARATQFLRKIVPYGIAATANLYGIEGFHLKDVIGIVAVSLPAALSTRSVRVDVEVRGELTRGMSVIDQRAWRSTDANVELAHEVDGQAVRDYIAGVLRETA